LFGGDQMALTCEHCGQPFRERARKSKRFCSAKCRMAAMRDRLAETADTNKEIIARRGMKPSSPP
jgi:endogenous inhibitor of DNA gyrase (YacG/DUF329 family)